MDEIRRRLYRRNDIANIHQFAAVIQQEWTSIPEDVINNLTLSMRRQIQVYEASREGHTVYLRRV